MFDLLQNPDYEFFRPLVAGWVAKIDAGMRARSKWKEVADECHLFYSKSAAAMWDQSYSKKFWSGVKAPKFRITINKAFELVAVFGPNLFWECPYRTVTPKKQVELLGLEAIPELAQFAQQIQQESQSESARDKLMANLMQLWLNYTPREQPGDGLYGQSFLAVTDALVKGRGCLFIRPYQFPSSGRTLTGAFRESPDDVILDPDFDCLEDCKWIALKHVDPHWEVERKFELPSGSLKNRASLESSWQVSELRATEDKGNPHRAAGTTNNLVVWYEVWSKTGAGARMTGMPSAIKDQLESTVGDYAYLAICPDCPYPLNCSTEFLRSGASEEEVRQAFEWPVPLWADDRWPMECHDGETEVLTRDGWVLFSELSGDELLATVNLDTDTLEYQKPTKLVARRHVGEMVRFEGRQKLDALVTPQHRMVVYPAHSHTPVVKAAANINRSDLVKMSAANWVGVNPQLPEFLAGVDSEAFAEWLGFYIAEGHCAARRTKRNGPRSWQVTITQKKPAGRVYYERLLERLPFHTHPYRRRCGSYTISSKSLWTYLRDFGTSAYTKRVPQWIKDAPQRHIKAFLRGYIAGDGHESPDTGQITSCTASPMLADDLQELWLKAGKSASLHRREPVSCVLSEPGRDSRTVTSGVLTIVGVRERTRASLKSGRDTLYRTESGYDDMVYCATVPNGTLVTRRNGKTIITGNCLDFYPSLDSAWPIPPMAPAMGELKFLNFLIPWLCNRIYNSSRDFWAVLGPHVEHYTKYLKEGEDQSIIPCPPGTDDIRKAIQVLQQPETRADVWRIVELVSDMFDKRTGLTDGAYGKNEDGTQNRTAEETMAKQRAVGVRPEHMQKRVVAWQSNVAAIEAFLARMVVTGEDVEPLMGRAGRMLWEQLVMSSDVEKVCRQMQFEISAASIRRPNRDRDVANLQQVMGIWLPVAQQAVTAPGDYSAANALLKKWGELHDMDVEDMLIPAPDQQQQEMQQQQGQLAMEQMQAETQKTQAEAQKAMAEAQANPAELKMAELQMEQESEEMSMQLDIEKTMAELAMKLKAQRAELQMDAEKHRQEIQQKQQEGQINLTLKAQQGRQQLQQGEQQHKQAMQQNKQQSTAKVQAIKAQAKAKPKPANGKPAGAKK